MGPAAVKVRAVSSARLRSRLKCWPVAPGKVKYPPSQSRVALYADRCLLAIRTQQTKAVSQRTTEGRDKNSTGEQ